MNIWFVLYEEWIFGFVLNLSKNELLFWISVQKYVICKLLVTFDYLILANTYKLFGNISEFLKTTCYKYIIKGGNEKLFCLAVLKNMRVTPNKLLVLTIKRNETKDINILIWNYCLILPTNKYLLCFNISILMV